jgi:HSP20 family molecular chaperone IbpA
MKPVWVRGEFPVRLSPDGDRIHIHAELQGISEEKIRLDVDLNTLTISASDGDTWLKKEISLPWEARLGRKRFREGVLELTLEKSDR